MKVRFKSAFILEKYAYRKHTAGFTLIELLASITIMALLIALIFIGARAVRKHTEAINCVSNLRTLGGGFAMYATEHNNEFPDGYVDGYWMDRIAPYVSKKSFFCPTAVRAEEIGDSVKHIEEERMWKDMEIRVSYGYNYRYLGSDFYNQYNPPEKSGLYKADRLSELMVLADAGRLSDNKEVGGWGFYLMEPQSLQWSTPLPRHSGYANILWADGHVSKREVVLSDGRDKPYEYIKQWNWDYRYKK